MSKQHGAFYKNIDWVLLLFIVGATYSKLYVKVAAVFLYFLYTVYRKYEFRKPVSVNSFYVLILVTGTISSLLQGAFAKPEYLFGYLLGGFTWLIGGAISYLTYIGVVNLNEVKLHQTVKAFFLLNALVCFVGFWGMVSESGHLMPYWYWDVAERFGSSTGDQVRGIFGSNSVTNAMINVLGIVYFSHKKEFRWAFLCLLICQMCTSNLTLLMLMGLLVAIIVMAKDRRVKLNAFLLSILTVVIYPILSPLNLKYISTTYSQGVDESKAISFRKIDTTELKKTFPGPVTDNQLEANFKKYEAALKSNYFHVKVDKNNFVDFSDDMKYVQYYKKANAPEGGNIVLKQSFLKSTIEKWYGMKYEWTPLNTYYKPIKLYSFTQTLYFLKSNLSNLLFGAGVGNFSSKLAIKTTGLNMQGSYPVKNIYINRTFVEYHLYTLFYVFSLPVSEHSIINMPNSVYNQIAGEYGLIGISLFVFLYLGFFWVNRQTLTYGRFLLILTLMCFGFDYWFEMLSFTVVFELLMFQDIFKKEEVSEPS